MAGCPKVNPHYPVTATSVELPFGVIVRRADPGFDRERRFDPAYRFRHRRFVEDALLHGAYLAPVALAANPLLTRGAQDGPVPQGPFSASFSEGFEGVPTVTTASLVAAIDAQFRGDNGFCDPIDNGTVQTGTGAGGRDPGAVPSLAALIAQQGYIIATEDGRALAPDGQVVGVVFYGGTSPGMPAVTSLPSNLAED